MNVSTGTSKYTFESLKWTRVGYLGRDNWCLVAGGVMTTTTTADVDDTAARNDWGWKPKHHLRSAFEEYLVPSIKARYA